MLPLWLRGQGMEIGNDEKALVFVLEPDAVLKRAYIVTQMHIACWPIAGQDPFSLFSHDLKEYAPRCRLSMYPHPLPVAD